MTTPTRFNVRCASANCFGQAKRLSLLRGLFKRCGLCDARRPFRRIFKCVECKTTFHRRCATKALCTCQSAGRMHYAPAGVRENVPANPKTTITVAVATTQTTDDEMTTTKTTTNETNITDVIVKQTLEDAPAEVCGDGVREIIPANPNTTTAAAITETTNHCLPPTQHTKITSLDYFKFVLEKALTEKDKIHLKELIACAPRPSPLRSSFTRTDYMEMCAAWEEPTFRRYRRREMYRVVYPLTVQNSNAN